MQRVKVGKIVGTHALKGELKIQSHSDFSQQRFMVGNCLEIAIDDTYVEVEITTLRLHKGNYLVTFNDYKDINVVEKYVGCDVYGPLDRELLEQDEYFYHDIYACHVYTETQEYLGKVIDILSNGRHDIIKVEGDQGVISIPYVDAFIQQEDIENKKIIVRLIAGMIP